MTTTYEILCRQQVRVILVDHVNVFFTAHCETALSDIMYTAYYLLGSLKTSPKWPTKSINQHMATKNIKAAGGPTHAKEITLI